VSKYNGRLRVEETPPVVALVEHAPPVVDVEAEVHRWRKMAVDAGERLAYAENQLKDLRQAADDARARFSKYKSRLDGANERVNDLQAQLIAACAERDTLRARLVQQDVVKQKVWEYRQSLIDGPLFELFGEYCK
jgi:chromosome segregation ATPase